PGARLHGQAAAERNGFGAARLAAEAACHRLVEQRDALSRAPLLDKDGAQLGHGAELQVEVAHAPPEVERLARGCFSGSEVVRQGGVYEQELAAQLVEAVLLYEAPAA